MFKKIFFFFFLLSFFFPQKVFAGDIVINEFFVDSSIQWVELYNKGSSVVNISGWFIDDNGGTQKYTIPSETTINPSEFKTFDSGLFNFNKTTPDEARLINGSITEDSYSYSIGPGSGKSFGRSSDGIGDWVIFDSPTKGITNNSSSSAPVPTPTPSPISSPTPTPTATPKPSTPKPLTSSTPVPVATTVAVNLTRSEDNEATASVLSESSPSSKLLIKSPTPKPTTKVASENNFQKILIGVGILFIVSSGFWFMRSLKQNE